MRKLKQDTDEVKPARTALASGALVVTLTVEQLREVIADVAVEFIEGQPQAAAANDGGFLDRTGAAKFLKVSLSQLDKLCRDAGCPFHIVGDVRRFDRDELRAWVRRAR